MLNLLFFNSAFFLLNWENKAGPGAQTDSVQMAVSKLVPTVLSRGRDKHFYSS